MKYFIYWIADGLVLELKLEQQLLCETMSFGFTCKCMSVCLSVFYLIEQVKFWQLLADVDLLYFHRGQPQHRELHALLS